MAMKPLRLMTPDCDILTRFHPVDVRYEHSEDMTAEEITDASNTWHMFNGFNGDHCSNCEATMNVIGGGPGFFCPRCGAYNCQSWHGGMMPLRLPMYGPTAQTIRKGIRASNGYIKYRLEQDGPHWRFWDTLDEMVNIAVQPHRAFGGFKL